MRSRFVLTFQRLERRLLLSVGPSPLEQELLEHVNRMRLDPAGELDVLFSSHPTPLIATDADVQDAIDFFGVDGPTLESQWASLSPAPPLAWNDALYKAATDHSALMIAHDEQAHVLPGELGLLDRIVEAGYDWQFSVGVAENVYAYASSPFYAHAGFVIDWGYGPAGIQDPPGHRDTIMNPNLQEIGISAIPEADSQTDVGPLVVTQDFGRRGNYGNPQILGVVYADQDGNQRYDAGEHLGGVTVTISGPGGVFTTETWSAGGYQIRVPDGTYTVTASGGGLPVPMQVANVTVAGANVKVDIDSSEAVFPPQEDLVGRADNGDWWVARSTGTDFVNEKWGRWSESAGWTDVMTADVDGDGLGDIIGRTRYGDWWVARSSGTDFGNEKWGRWSATAAWIDVAVGDVNGDGRADIVGRTNNGDWWVARSNGSSFINEKWGGWSAAAGWTDVSVGDVNGDGRDDIAGRTSSGDWWVARSTGTGFVNEKWGRWSAAAGWADVAIADVNGDGRGDIVGRTSNGDWWVARSNGAGFTNEKWGRWSTAAWTDVSIADVDGDGLDDVVGRAQGNWWVAHSTGSGFTNELWGSWSPSVAWADVQIGDFNGDGRDDVAGRANGNWWLAKSDGTKFINEKWGNWSTGTNWQNVAVGNLSNHPNQQGLQAAASEEQAVVAALAEEATAFHFVPQNETEVTRHSATNELQPHYESNTGRRAELLSAVMHELGYMTGDEHAGEASFARQTSARNLRQLPISDLNLEQDLASDHRSLHGTDSGWASAADVCWAAPA